MSELEERKRKECPEDCPICKGIADRVTEKGWIGAELTTAERAHMEGMSISEYLS